MTSRHPLGLLATTILIGSACGRASEAPAPTPLSAPNAAGLVELAPRAPDSTSHELPAELAPHEADSTTPEPPAEPETATDGAPDEPPIRPRPDRAPTEAPTGSVNPNLPAPELEPGGGSDKDLAPSPNIDLSYQGQPLFIENDPLETSGVLLCGTLIRGLRECWPKLDPEVRELTGELLAEAVNLARSLKRPFVRERACEMGWDLARLYAPRCPGVFPAEEPPAADGE